MRRSLLTGQSGFSLIELLVVMSIVSVLAGIVSMQVAGSNETSRDVRAQQDAISVSTAVAHFFFDQIGAELVTPSTVNVNDEGTVVVTTSSKWPEITLTSGYGDVFQETGSTVRLISFFNGDGSPSVLSLGGLLQNYNAINFFDLEQGGYVQALPKSVVETSKGFSNYLWLLKKDTAAGGGGTVSSREVEVFKLVTIQQAEGIGPDILNYTHLVGES